MPAWLRAQRSKNRGTISDKKFYYSPQHWNGICGSLSLLLNRYRRPFPIYLRPEVKNTWLYTPTPLYALMVWLLMKHRNYLIFALLPYIISHSPAECDWRNITIIYTPLSLKFVTHSAFLNSLMSNTLATKTISSKWPKMASLGLSEYFPVPTCVLRLSFFTVRFYKLFVILAILVLCVELR